MAASDGAGGGGGAKLCSACGNDCTGKPRTRDQTGRYWCEDCVRRLKQERKRSGLAGTAAAETAAPPAEADGYDLEAVAPPEAAAAPARRCPKCTRAMGPHAVVCIGCGYNARTGVRATTEGAEGRRGRELKCRQCGYDLSGLPGGACPECGSNRGYDKRTDEQKRESRRLGRMSYLRPALAMLVSLAVFVVFAFMVQGLPLVLAYALVFPVQLTVGIIVYLLCSLMWIGFDEPVIVMGLRLGFIYAVISGLWVVLSGVGFPFWILMFVLGGTMTIMFTLTMDNEYADSAYAALFSMFVQVGVFLFVISLFLNR